MWDWWFFSLTRSVSSWEREICQSDAFDARLNQCDVGLNVTRWTMAWRIESQWRVIAPHAQSIVVISEPIVLIDVSSRDVTRVWFGLVRGEGHVALYANEAAEQMMRIRGGCFWRHLSTARCDWRVIDGCQVLPVIRLVYSSFLHHLCKFFRIWKKNFVESSWRTRPAGFVSELYHFLGRFASFDSRRSSDATIIPDIVLWLYELTIRQQMARLSDRPLYPWHPNPKHQLASFTIV